MKLFLSLIGLAAAGALGYFAEPSLRKDLTGISPAAAPPAAEKPSAPIDPAPAEPAPDMMAAAGQDMAGTAPAQDPPGQEMAAAEPAPAPEPAPEAPAPAPEPAPAAAELVVVSADEAVKIMQDSIRAGQVSKISYDNVLDWKGGEKETIDGEEFQTGVVSYKQETILGVKTFQAKALIRGGKVQRWTNAKTGMDMN